MAAVEGEKKGPPGEADKGDKGRDEPKVLMKVVINIYLC